MKNWIVRHQDHRGHREMDQSTIVAVILKMSHSKILLVTVKPRVQNRERKAGRNQFGRSLAVRPSIQIKLLGARKHYDDRSDTAPNACFLVVLNRIFQIIMAEVKQM